ncbi:MAG: hypothetical protein J6U93_07625 [Alistipes sp.]|nr:hypothetical protein [Alistipes sp.]
MSYCRFRNTSIDFEDCINGLNDIINGEDDALSPDKLCAAERIYRMCEEYMEAFEDMNDLMR